MIWDFSLVEGLPAVIGGVLGLAVLILAGAAVASVVMDGLAGRGPDEDD